MTTDQKPRWVGKSVHDSPSRIFYEKFKYEGHFYQVNDGGENKEQIAIILDMWETKIGAKKEVSVQFFLPCITRNVGQIKKVKEHHDVKITNFKDSKSEMKFPKPKSKQLVALEYITVISIDEIVGRCRLQNIKENEPRAETLIRNVMKSKDQYYFKCSRRNHNSNLLKNTPRTEEFSQQYLFRAMQRVYSSATGCDDSEDLRATQTKAVSFVYVGDLEINKFCFSKFIDSPRNIPEVSFYLKK